MQQHDDTETKTASPLDQQLVDLARKIEAWRVQQNLTKLKFVDRFKHQLKSYRTIERASKASPELGEMDVQIQLEKLQLVWAQIETGTYDDTTMALALRNAFAKTMTKTGPNRVILLIGPTGRGKSRAIEALQQIHGTSRIVKCEATKVWRDKPLPMLQHIWEQMGFGGEFRGAADGLKKVKAELKRSRKALCFDEAHYFGPDQLNAITSMVNDTPGEFIIAGQPTLWERLERDRGAYAEAQQLTRNRLSCRIKKGSLSSEDKSDIKLIVSRQLPWLKSQEDKACATLLLEAPKHGNLGFVRNVIERITDAIEFEGGEENWETFEAALEAELAER
jgi:energy-coupling factor transporter ATP-binding protein EcfA2